MEFRPVDLIHSLVTFGGEKNLLNLIEFFYPGKTLYMYFKMFQAGSLNLWSYTVLEHWLIHV